MAVRYWSLSEIDCKQIVGVSPMSETPYLSVVVTARNDNHGGNMLRRMQIFVSGLLEQCRRYKLPAELVLVEWNPPADRPRLAEALDWSPQPSPCQIRIIEVPPEAHQRFNHSDVLPLFQMLGKNVGIRRARGQFVLATNIDLLFTNELFDFLASRKLKSDEIYRVDRYDVPADVPLGCPIDEQLAYCENHILRINHRCGTDILKPEPVEIEAIADTPAEPTEPQPSSIDWDSIPESLTPTLLKIRSVYRRLLPVEVKDFILRLMPTDLVDWLIRRGLLTVQPPPPPPEPATVAESEPVEEPILPQLHLNACGDFTLMDREHWFALRGYPEFEMHGLHLDSILCFAAHYRGLKERVLGNGMRAYHIEHTRTWFHDVAPETFVDHGNAEQIPKLSFEQLVSFGLLMKQLKRPLTFNEDSWGLGNLDLPEIEITVPSRDSESIAASNNLVMS